MTTPRVLADPRVRLGARTAALIVSAVPVVGLARIYPGAHLPLDVAGGAALGLVIDAALTLVKENLEPKGPCYRDLGP